MKLPLVLLALCALLCPGLRAASCCAAAPAPAAASELPADSVYHLEAHFTDDAGRAVGLDQLRGKPVALAMFFSNCITACPAILADLASLHARLRPQLARDTQLVLVSFDTERDTPTALAEFREQRALDRKWVLLHGDDASVRELAAVLGVKFRREADGQFAHSNVITILNPEGTAVHRRVGLQGGLEEAATALNQLNYP